MPEKFISRYCGVCGGKRQMRLRVDRLYVCQGCQHLFDGEPDEHGASLHHDPGRALDLKEREERRARRDAAQARRQQLRGGR